MDYAPISLAGSYVEQAEAYRDRTDAELLGSAAMQQPAAPLSDREEWIKWAAERKRDETEGSLRLSVYLACGGDGELRCQQFASKSQRGIAPTIPIGSVKCQDAGPRPGIVQDCTFTLGHEHRSTVACSVTFHKRAGEHMAYWSDQIVSSEPVHPSQNDGIASVRLGRSSLKCSEPLLALTDEPEKVDPAPAIPPKLNENSSAPLITQTDYSYAASKGYKGLVVMKIRVGSHGRIDRCTTTQSSGVKYLDDTACEQISARAYFQPAVNAQGQAVAVEISLSHSWKATP
ncbi:TonB family protein [Sphingomonas sp. UYAg733]